jgi:rod shape determining protein RodA
MSLQDLRKRGTFDWVTITLYISLLAIGWLMVYASSYKGSELNNVLDLSTQYGKQFLWILISLVIFVFSMILDSRFWHTFAYPIYGISMLLLLAVLFLGVEIKGSTSWFIIGGFSFQPAEFAKFGTALGMSSYLSYYKTDIKTRKSLLLAFLIFLLPAALIILQPDAGSALVFASFFLLLYREGLSPIYYIAVFCGIFLFVVSLVFPIYQVLAFLALIASIGLIYYKGITKNLYVFIGFALLISLNLVLFNYNYALIALSLDLFMLLGSLYFSIRTKHIRISISYISIFVLASLFSLGSDYAFNNILKPHQQERINVWLQPELCDPRGSLYNVLQSKTAIGSGGFTGKGFLKGTMTKFNYVPEQSTDFIFCTVGEEQGFLGVISVLLIYMGLLMRILSIAERSKQKFTRCYAYSVLGILFIHLIINIGMTMGLVPIIGIPLPFISYGGSSLIIFSLMIGVLLKLDSLRYR